MKQSLYEWCVDNNRFELLKEWDDKKNNELTLHNIAAGSDKKARWVCNKGHSYDMQINKRTLRGNSCPICSGHRVLAGYNDLATTHPEIAAEWNIDRNDCMPQEVSKGSNRKVWWKCKNGHEWEAQINDRVGRNHGCPYCSGHRPIVGENDLATMYPELCKEWNYEKNGELMPQKVLPQSNKKVWWHCVKCGNDWETAIYHRVGRKTGCPKCAISERARKSALAQTGIDDLVTLYPEIASEWHPEKNGSLHPNEVKGASGKKVWWKCKKGHEWQAQVISRTKQGRGCPICSGQMILKGYNDLATTHPALAQEWDYDKNGELKATEVSKGSDKKVYWRCEKGHSWKAAISSRAMGVGCPQCAKERHISFPEKAIAYYMEVAGLEVIENYRTDWLGKSELDIFLPALKLGIEYDGQAWHTNGAKDLKKDLLCFANGVGIIRIREPKCPKIIGAGPLYIMADTKDKGLTDAIKFIFETLEDEYAVEIPSNVEIDIAKDRIKIFEHMELGDKEKSLSRMHPKLAEEWNYYKNSTITPEKVSEKSNKKVWWKCRECGYEWEAAVASRVLGNGCPKCGKERAASSRSKPEFADSLKAVNPEICVEWDYERNGSLMPEDVFPFSHRMVWWKCKKGHMWQASVSNRSSGKGCPFCSGLYPIAGETDLETVFPEVASEWHPTLNGELTAKDVLAGSSQKVWWKCKNGHEWEALISNRTGKNHTGCPICSGRKVLKGFNDLLTTHPALAKEWNENRNGALSCKDVTIGSNKKVWWKCGLGHEWQATISSRGSGNSCPYCANRILLKGFNDLATTHPKIAEQWHPTRNGELTPSDVFAGSAKKVWWQCKEGHEWQATLNSRTTCGTGCPYCAGQRVLRGVNDLKTMYPQIATEWDYERNKNQVPEDFMSKSNREVWWKCSQCGYSFKKKIVQRVLYPLCPNCKCNNSND